MPKEEKIERMMFEADAQHYAPIKKLMDEKGFNLKEAMYYIIDGKTVSDDSIPEKCKSCGLFGKFFNGKVMCIVRLENKQPIIKYRSLIEAQGCSTVPTLITMARKEELTREIQNRGQMEKHWKDECMKARKPIEDLLKEKSILELRVSDVANSLLERDGKIAVLETDNEQFRAQIAKLSENELLTENDSLRVQLIGKGKLIDDYTLEIEKLEALTQKQRQTVDDVISKTKETFREFKQVIPAWLEPHGLHGTVETFLKKINYFEGYLNTVAP